MITREFKLSIKSQVTIPQKVKAVLRIAAGDAILFDINHGHVEIRPVHEKKISLFEFGGKYKTIPSQKVTLEDMRSVIKRRQKRIALGIQRV